MYSSLPSAMSEKARLVSDELLALVERWLEAHRLPEVSARYGGRSYLIVAPEPAEGWRDVDPYTAA